MRARTAILVLVGLSTLLGVDALGLVVRGPQTFVATNGATVRIVNDSTNIVVWRSLTIMTTTNGLPASGTYKVWWQRSGVSNLLRNHSYTNRATVVEYPEGQQQAGLNDAYIFQNNSTNTIYVNLNLQVAQ